MCRSLPFLILLTILSCTPFSVIPDSETDDEKGLSKEHAWLFSLSSDFYAGRKVGTVGNKRAYDYILSEVCKMGYNPNTQLIVHSSGDTLRNIIVDFPGIKDSCIIIGAHFDGPCESNSSTHYPAANDNASGVVTVLSFLECLTRINTSNYSIRCCFWDGEEASVRPAFKGSEYYVRHSLGEMPVLLYVNVDAMGHSHDNTMILGYYGGGRVFKMVSFLMEQSVFNYTLTERNAGAGSSDYRSFSAVKIPYVSFTDSILYCDYCIHSDKDIPEMVDLERLCKVRDILVQIVNLY